MNKKKITALLCAVLALLMLLPCITAAASFTKEADTLKKLGLFKGTNNGYELDRAPTRAEAAVMLVRFLGKEADSQKLKWKAPFTDVPDWAKPYVQYLYENKLTAGMSETKYGPDETCSAQMYATFLLRALGYSDAKGDFSYSDAVNFARIKGVINGSNYNKDKFLRDNMVGMSYASLLLPTADGKYDELIYKLAADGAVSKAEADTLVYGSRIAEKLGDGVTDAYLKRYADYDAANEWTKKNITDAKAPPVKFTIDGKSSDSVSWEKKTSAKKTVVDYPDDEPVNRTYYTVTYTASQYGIELVLTVTEYSDYPVVEYEAYINNTGSGNSKVIKDVKSINANIHAGTNVTLHSFHGCDYELTEYQPIDTKMSSSGTKTKSFSVENGKGTSTYLPNFNIEDTKNKSGVIAVISWEGNWSSKFDCTNSGINWSAGQLRTNFQLTSKESYRVPMTVLLFYKGDQFNGQNIWRRWFYRHNVLRAQGERMDLNFLMCCGVSEMTACNEKADLSAIAALSSQKMGKYIRSYTQDAGWYETDATGANAWFMTGNWYPDPKRYPNGLRPVTDAVHKAGMNYTLWLEPERAVPGTKTFKDLKNNMICLNGSGQLISYTAAPAGSSCMVNLSKKEAVDYLINLLDGIVTDYNIDMYRQDCNFCVGERYKNASQMMMSDYWSAYDMHDAGAKKIQRTGMTENLYCTGLLTFWDEIVKRHPSLVIDCCASGGQRYTLKCARYSFMHTRTDWVTYTPDNNVLDPTVNAQCDSYTLSMWYQLTGSGTAMLGNKYDMRSRLVTSFGFGVNPYGGNSFTEVILSHTERKAEIPFVIEGDYYPLTSYSEKASGQMILQFTNPDSAAHRIYCYFRSSGTVTVKPRDVISSASYQYYFVGSSSKKTKISGSDLISKGITFEGQPLTASVIVIEKI